VVGYLVAAAVVVSATSPPQSPAPAALLDTPLLQEESHTFVQTPQHPDPHLQFSSDEAYPTSLEHGQAFSTPPGQHHGRESEGQSGQDGRGTDLKNYRVQQTQDQTHEQGQPYRQEAFGSQIDGQGPQQEDLQDQTVGADTFSSGSFQRGQAEYPKIPGVSKGVSAAGVGVQGEASQSFRRNFRGGDSDQQQEVPSTLSSRPRGAAVSRGSHKYDEDEQHEDEQDNLKMGNYEYSYNIRSEETGDMKFHQETRDGGKVVGEYRVKEADGTMRVVKYSADKDNGFQATFAAIPGHQDTPRVPQGSSRGSERPSGFSQDLQSFQQENAKLRPDTQEFRQRPGAFVDNFPEAEGQATSTNFNNQHQQSLKQEQSRGSTQQDFQGQFKTHVRDNSQTQNREQFRSQHRNRFPSTIRRQPLTEAKNQFQSQKGGQLDGDSRGQYQTPRSKQFSLTQERNRFRIQDSQFQAQDRSNFQGQDSRFQAQDRSNFQGQDSQFQAQDRINFQGQDSQFQAQDRSNFQGQDSQFQTQDTRQFQTQGGRQFDTQEESQMYRQDSQQEVLEGRNQFQTLEREQFQSQDRRPFRTQDNRRFQTEAGSQYQSPNRGQFSSQNRDLYLNQRNEQFQSRAQGQLQTQSDSQLKSQRRRKFQSQLIDDYETRRRNPSLPQNKVQLQDSLQGTRFQGQKNYQFDRQQTATTGDNTYDNKRYSDDSLSSTIDQSEYPTRRYGTGIQRQTIVGDGVYPKTIGNQRYGARDTVILEPHPPQRRNFAPVNSDNSRSSNYHQQDVPQIDSIDQRAQAQTEADTLQDGTFQASVKYSDRSSQHVQTPKLSQTTNFQSRQQSTNQEQVAPSERFQASNSLRERHQDDRNQPLSVSPQFQNEDVTQTSQNPAAPTEAKFYGPIHEEETPRRPQVSASVLQRSNFQTVAEPHPQA
ncbi:Adult-specific cuticular protein ACP-20-like 1, partial [Homarus americanus]